MFWLQSIRNDVMSSYRWLYEGYAWYGDFRDARDGPKHGLSYQVQTSDRTDLKHVHEENPSRESILI